jgi:hypothetical protein
VRLANSALPLVNGERVQPRRKLGEALANVYTRISADADARTLGPEEGGVVTLVQDRPVRTEVCALYGPSRLGKD